MKKFISILLVVALFATVSLSALITDPNPVPSPTQTTPQSVNVSITFVSQQFTTNGDLHVIYSFNRNGVTYKYIDIFSACYEKAQRFTVYYGGSYTNVISFYNDYTGTVRVIVPGDVSYKVADGKNWGEVYIEACKMVVSTFESGISWK